MSFFFRLFPLKFVEFSAVARRHEAAGMAQMQRLHKSSKKGEASINLAVFAVSTHHMQLKPRVCNSLQ
jgi:hypothetical protein